STKLIDNQSRVKPPGPGELCWIDVQQYQAEELHAVGDAMGFHQLAIADCQHEIERAKLDDYEKYLFIVMHSMSMSVNGRRGVHSTALDSFLGENYLVTVHSEPLPAIDALIKRAATDLTCCARGADYLFYLIVDALVDEAFPIVDKLSDQIEEVESAILRRSEPSQLAQLMRLKRLLISMRRVLSPERDVLAMMIRRGDPRVQDRTAIYFRDVYDHVVRAYEQIDVERDLLGNAMDAYMSMNANRSNVIMKQLTLLASIFLPLTFLTGFFGQNFSALPFDSRSLFYIEIAACVALPVTMVYWFRRSGWW
ncbi:MAG TPA: magnesium/cobalt transporter CorA, partial [Candidatus Binataceae bacterium]|nr:magnesium/cobalt transporter CorA [Candidatus Binataceae bacterium]